MTPRSIYSTKEITTNNNCIRKYFTAQETSQKNIKKH